MGNKKHRFEPLTEKEIDMLISNCKHPDLRDLIMILRETGCRVREILNLRTEDIHFRDGYALLHVKHDNKRKGGIRHVPVFECLPIVRRLVRDQKNGQPLFRYNYIAQYRRLKAMVTSSTQQVEWLSSHRSLYRVPHDSPTGKLCEGFNGLGAL